MSDELHTYIEPELEARIVAWVLGEASAFEREELERLTRENPELAIFKRRIEAVHTLVGEVEKIPNAGLKLSQERRAQLLKKIGGAGGRSSITPIRSVRQRLRPWKRAIAALLIGSLTLSFLWVSFRYVQLRGAIAALGQSGIANPRSLSSLGFGVSEEVEADLFSNRERIGRAVAGPPAVSVAPVPSAGPTPRSATESLAELKQQIDGDGSGHLAFNESAARGVTESGETDRRRNLAESERMEHAPEFAAANERVDAAEKEESPPSSPTKPASDSSMPAEVALGIAGLTGGWAKSGPDGPGSSVPGRDYSALEAEDQLQPVEEASREAGQAVATRQLEVAQATLDGRFGMDASDEVRSRSVAGVDNYWASPVSQFGDGSGERVARLKNVQLRDATMVEALEVLKKEAEQVGQEFNVRSELEGALAENAKVTLSLENIPADEALDYVASLAGAKVKQDAGGLAIVPMSEPTDVLVTKEYRVPPGFVSSLGVASSDGRSSMSGLLENAGVQFPAGASAHYLPSSGKLVIRNTPENLDLVDALTMSASVAPGSEETLAEEEPFSTFSLHVSDVSFELARAALERGEMPEAERIRPEEFYNAFDYGDPSPATGEEVACRIEQAAHPVLQQRNLVRIAMQVAAAGRAAGQSLRLTILLDTSGSMEREDREASVRKAMEVLASLLAPQDRVTLIGFARKPRLLADGVAGDQAEEIVRRVAQTPSEGGTNLEEALKLATDLAQKHFEPQAQNRVVLLTDGAANLGNADPAQLAAMIETLRQRGVAFDACGVGAEGLNDEMLETLTRKGDGRYYFLNSPEEADEGFARKLAGAFRPAAENVKVQVRWNPARVGRYRLVGFEKHRLRKEDFRNDKVDAAELAAEEAAVALYQVEVLPDGEGELGDVFVRYREASSGRMIERSWTMAFQANAPAYDEATGSMQLAGLAAMMAEKLAGTAVGSMVQLEDLAPVATQVRGKFAHDPRAQELVRMFEILQGMER